MFGLCAGDLLVPMFSGMMVVVSSRVLVLLMMSGVDVGWAPRSTYRGMVQEQEMATT